MMTQELDREDSLAIVTRLNADDGAALIAALTDDEAQTLVDRLKAGADKYWAINPNRSLEMADTIITIADGRDNLSHKALGMMARGDALKLLGETKEAWMALEDAGENFLRCEDMIGWARTRIGKVYLCVSVNQVEEALTDATKAYEVFVQSGSKEFLIRLNSNVACVHYWRGDHQKALHWLHEALTIAEAINEKQFLGALYINLGNVYYDFLGDFRAASDYYHQALFFGTNSNDIKIVAIANHNLAFIAMGQGRYPNALQLFYQARELYDKEHLAFDVNHVDCEIVECYLLLNRFVEARELATKVVNKYLLSDDSYNMARALIHLATAEAELKHLDLAQKNLSEAEAIFARIDAGTWVATTRLRLGKLTLKQGDLDSARLLAEESTAFFQSSGQKVHYAVAMLLQSQILLSLAEPYRAKQGSTIVLETAQTINVPLLRYSAHLLLGHIARSQGDISRATRRYKAAIATIERVQRSMTITLRSGFLEDKGEALESLIALYIQMGDSARAFETLEHTKSQVFFNYISNRQLLHWSQDDPKSQSLIQELDRLRGEHHWWYQKAHGEVQDEQTNEKATAFEDALKEIAIRERRMRIITEQLYLQSSTTAALLPSSAPHLEDIQKNLDQQTLLIEFYHDDKNVWMFTIDATSCGMQQSSASIQEIERDLDFLHFNIDTVLSADVAIVQTSVLTKQARFLLQRMFEQLLKPITSLLHNYRRLIFVPYGSLHYVPFHLLFTGTSYLIENHEMVVLPAGGYVTRNGPSRTSGASVIAYSLNGKLPHAVDEAQIVHNLFDGTVCIEDRTSRSALQEAPTQILHIATHAEYRQQQPDLSYIELADGHLFTDDLFQQDLSYELVTLSACETGRSHVASSDELIGLGRGFLYAGAGALVTSLWRVIDDITPRLMEYFYRELHAGASKAAALRAAQLAILNENPQMHPAFWGAFQLVGDPRPLSSDPGTKNDR